MKIQRCKGMRDLSPADMRTFHMVAGICRDCFSGWGYKEVRTPTIEYLHLFTSAGTLTPNMLGKVYSFLDWDGWSGERVVLRPDGTIPVARLYTETCKRGLARLFYASNVFTFEESAKKTRERWQCGAELIGIGSAMADTELIVMSLDTLKKLGLNNVELRLSHSGLIRAILEKFGMSADEQHRMFDRILDGDAETLAKVGHDSSSFEEILRPLLSLKGQSTSFLRNQRALLARNMPEICSPLDDFLKTVGMLDNLGIKYQINIPSGAGFEYYTGIVFQLFAGGEKIGGGGRYDALISAMGGGDIPASGFALYLDQLIKMVIPEKLSLPSPEIVVVKLSDNAMKEAFKAAESLRQSGYTAELDLDGKKPKDGWLITVRSTAPRYKVTRKSKIGNIELQTMQEVIKLLGEKGGNKNSSA